MASRKKIPEDPEKIEDNSEYLDPKDFEVIEIDEDSNMDDIEDQLSSAMNRLRERTAATQNVGGEAEEELEMEEDVPLIVEDAEEKTASHIFREHKEPVFSCAVSKCGSIAITGGKDDTAHVWNTYTGQLLLTCTGHEDSVTYVGMNHDNQYAATADMNGKVQVWRIRDGECVFSFETGGGEGNDEADTYENWLSWHHRSNILFCGTRNSGIWVWLIPQQVTKTIPQFGLAVTSGCCTEDGKRLVVGYSDGKTRVVDIKSQEALMVEPRGYHKGEVLAVACHPENILALTGGSDGIANVINTNSGKVVGQIDMERLSSSPSSSSQDPSFEECGGGVEAIGFCSSNPSLAVVTDINGVIVVYEMTRQIVRHVLRQAAGISRLVMAPESSLCYTGGLDGMVRCWDLPEGKLLNRYTGHTDAVLGLSIDGSGKILLSCSDDSTARVFSVGSGASS